MHPHFTQWIQYEQVDNVISSTFTKFFINRPFLEETVIKAIYERRVGDLAMRYFLYWCLL